MLVCENFRREVEHAIAARGLEGVRTVSFPATCGARPIAWDVLGERFARSGEACDEVHVVASHCVAPGAPPEDGVPWQVHRFDVCHRMVASSVCVDHHLDAGAYLCTPGWLARWPAYVGEGGPLTPAAREMYRACAARVVLLDTGVACEASARHLAELSGYLGLPAEIVPVGTGHLGQFLASIVDAPRSKGEPK